MKKYILYLPLLILISITCRSTPESIPVGKWDYKLLVNGVEIGTATFSNRIENNNYVITTDMEMNAGLIKNTTKEIVTETLKFEPVKIEVYNKVISEKKTQNINTIAVINDKKIELDTGYSKTNLKIEKDFVLDGNYFMYELIKQKFKVGTKIKSFIYDPAVEIEEPILVKIEVVGRENISINNKTQNLIHIVQSIENIKNIDIYVNDKGITQKAVIKMLNNKIELIKK